MFIERKELSNIWSYDLVYEKTFRLSSHTPGYSLKSCPGHDHDMVVEIDIISQGS